MENSFTIRGGKGKSMNFLKGGIKHSLRIALYLVVAVEGLEKWKKSKSSLYSLKNRMRRYVKKSVNKLWIQQATSILPLKCGKLGGESWKQVKSKKQEKCLIKWNYMYILCINIQFYMFKCLCALSMDDCTSVSQWE